MSNKIFIDTLFVIALINKRDQYHLLARQLSDVLEHHPLVTTDAVLLEIGNALARNFKQQAVEIIDYFLASEDVDVIHLNTRLFRQAFDLYKQYQDKQWGLIDCFSFIIMNEQGIRQALTFDQHFVQAGFQALMQGDSTAGN